MYAFSIQGEPVNVPSKIIDYYFPNTTNQSINRQMYFDYKRIRRLLSKQLVQSYELENVILDNFDKIRYVVRGKVQKVSYRKCVRKQVVNHGVHGYTRNLKNGNVVVVIGGDVNIELNNFKESVKRIEKSES